MIGSPMKTSFPSTALALMLLAGSATSVAAQIGTRADTAVGAVVRIEDACIITSDSATQNDYVASRPESAVAVAAASLLAGMAGDAVTATLSAAGSAIEQAAREQSFSATGRTSFDFYRFALAEGSTTTLAGPATIVPVLRPRASQCLILAFEKDRPAGDSLDPTGSLTGPTLQPDRIAAWTDLGLPANPAVYIEAELQSRADGFVVRPVLVWYADPLDNSVRRALPAELHVLFATPALATDENALGAPFALARINLPRIEPGSRVRVASDLRLHVSPVMPLRPQAGSPAAMLAAMTTLETNVATSERDVVLLTRAEATAGLAAAATDAKPEAALAHAAAREDLTEAIATRDRLRRRIASARTTNPATSYGSTNVEARFAVVRNANAFAMAIAKSLQNRAAAVGTAATAALTPQTAEEAWTGLDTTYVAAMSTVDEKQAAFEAAVLNGDVAATLTARLALRNARAAANAAAAASGRALPFGDLLQAL